ncbi:hypothetical protein LSUE1_G003558 [Lachnellula suecica]|uniref:STE24 endopeptidase n=1 Tax=Lachnellula suecica TaxID=602035 RepID=A0A8T9C7J0_9HELO|nr:hypothetical protein LSUE1_G003558 [Lachnellula suecica]
MPTPLDRAMNSKNTFLAFAGVVTAASIWTIWGQDLFPKESDPTGAPEEWSHEELRRWLAAVSDAASSSHIFEMPLVVPVMKDLGCVVVADYVAEKFTPEFEGH